MDIVHILTLAFVQGASEFLPISSSGHLSLVHALGSFSAPSPLQIIQLDIALHSGTLLAVLFYFRQDCIALIKMRDMHLLRLLIIASLPAIIAGGALYISGAIVYLRPSDPTQLAALVAWANIIFAIPLWAADKWAEHKKSKTPTPTLATLSYRHALIIGIAQICAFIPGASRAGVTLMAGRALHIARPEAARFSMLLSIPIIAAFTFALIASLFAAQAGINTQTGITHNPDPAFLRNSLLAAGFAALIALATIHIFMRLMQIISLAPFILYRLVLGGILLYILYI